MAGVFQPAYSYVDSQLDQFLNQRLQDVIAEVDGPLRVALILYVVLYGLAVMRGLVNEPMSEGVGRMIKLAFVYTVATTVAYSSWVTDPLFHDLPNSLSHAVSGGDIQSIGQAFDDFLGRGFDLAESCAKSANMVDPLPWIVALLVYAATAAAAAVGFGITMLAKVSLALLVAIGPLFVACIPFEATRKYFWGVDIPGDKLPACVRAHNCRVPTHPGARAESMGRDNLPAKPDDGWLSVHRILCSGRNILPSSAGYRIWYCGRCCCRPQRLWPLWHLVSSNRVSVPRTERAAIERRRWRLDRARLLFKQLEARSVRSAI